jgi:O-antigen/teichoic acid export membrane protein
MSLTKKIAHNTFIQIVGKAIGMFLGLLTVALMTRYFGPEGFGQYTTIIAFLQFFGIIVDFGLAVIIIQLISARPQETEKLTSNIFTFRLVTAFFFFFLAPFAIWLFPYPAIIKWGVAVTSGALFLTSLNQVVISLFQRELVMIKVVIAELAGRIIMLVGVILVTWEGWGLLPVMGVVVIGNLANFILTFSFSRSITKIKIAFDWPVWREVFQKSWPIGLSIIFNLVYFKADTVILSLYRSQSEVGIYGATYKVLEILSAIPYMFMGLILPLLSAAWAQKDEVRFREIMQKTWDFMALITLPLVVGGIIMARPIMILVAGEEFTLAGPVLQILLVATGAIYLSTIFNHAVVALEEQRKMLVGFAMVAVISLAGYLLFIPLYSYWAAAGITVMAEVLILIISTAVVWRKIRTFVNFKVFNLSIIASLLMAVALLIFNSFGFTNLLFLLIVGAVLYFVLVYLLGGVDKASLQEIISRGE